MRGQREGWPMSHGTKPQRSSLGALEQGWPFRICPRIKASDTGLLLHVLIMLFKFCIF